VPKNDAPAAWLIVKLFSPNSALQNGEHNSRANPTRAVRAVPLLAAMVSVTVEEIRPDEGEMVTKFPEMSKVRQLGGQSDRSGLSVIWTWRVPPPAPMVHDRPPATSGPTGL